MKRYVLIVAAVMAAILLFLLTSASGNSRLFTSSYPYLLGLNGLLVVVLATWVGLQLRQLWREYRARQFGSRLKYRFVLMFALMGVVPGVVVYAVSLQFVVRSIQSWFDVRVESALESGIALGQNAFDYLVDQISDKAEAMAYQLERRGGWVSPALLNQLREQAGVGGAIVMAANGQIQAMASDATAGLIPDLPTAAQLRQVRQGFNVHVVENQSDGNLVIRVIVPIPLRTLAGEPSLLQLTQVVPDRFAHHAEAVQEAHRDYQQLSLGREGLNRIYTLTLTMTLLLALLAAVGSAFLIARRLVAPLLILAEGTQAVAQGDFSQRTALPARDELGVLLKSFNTMTRQLEESRAAAAKSGAAVEAARAYLETVLANLSTGVLAFDAQGMLRAANRGATNILDDELEGFEVLSLAEWPRLEAFRDAVLAGFAANSGDWQQQLELAVKDSTPQTLLINGSRLPAASGGTLVVFDDISRLIAAQRTAAWGEVARRLAHEIKNPLTPIQLSAERLAMKLAGSLGQTDREMLERATTTIVNQVEAMKNLVNAFRDYARLPTPQISQVDLNALICEVLNLYESAAGQIRLDLDPELPPVAGDASQLRQIIHNLLQNAEDALADSAEAELRIRTRQARERVVLWFCDNGPGFPAEVLAHAFEPYFTTKSRGTGLGLAMVKKIVDEHGGEIRLANHEGSGAEIRIRLRLAGASDET